MWNDSFAFLNCGKVAHEASLVTCHMPMMMIVEPKNVIQVMGSPKRSHRQKQSRSWQWY